ncbi:MAG: DUF2905 domain-containing protein [Balneolales bacterium]
MARWIILTGCIFIIAGIIMHYAPWIFNWFGSLPGDIRIQSGNSRIFIPVTSMILISIILTLVVNLLRRFLA